MTLIRCLVLVLVLWLELAPAAHSSPLRLTVVHAEPWGFVAQGSHRLQGIWVEVAAAVAAEAHFPVELHWAPYARVVRDLTHDRTEASFLARLPQREGKLIPVAHLFDFSTVILTRKGVSIEAYDDLAHLRIGVLPGAQLSPRFDKDNKLLKLPFRNYEILLHLLAIGRLDAIAGNSVSLAYWVRQRHLERQVGMTWTLQRTPMWLFVSPHSSRQAAIPVLRASVVRLRQQGVFEQIIGRYAGEKWKPR